MMRILAVLGRRTRFDPVDPRALPDVPWWAVDALRAEGFEPAGAVQVKPRLLPRSTTMLLTHPTLHADARVGFMPNAGEPTVGLTSSFSTGAVDTGHTGWGPLPEVLHQAFPGASPTELVARHRAALDLLAAHGIAVRPLDPAGAAGRYESLWYAEIGALRAMPRRERAELEQQMYDGGVLRGVPLAEQPGIVERLEAIRRGLAGGAP